VRVYINKHTYTQYNNSPDNSLLEFTSGESASVEVVAAIKQKTPLYTVYQPKPRKLKLTFKPEAF